ncbi:LysR family transcriptional regulator [Pluralibacter gergoviae]|uniref:LysR family transcriptional regulator n=1 Tax=Pluralibacter gergoviae TaxID=61647 RepID=UPI0004F904BE|nr:LysR family transcriptional regulator [Pluralibacter gergoviae]AIR00205.1 LysR family transcriptional regulator [Pluralibacter gergoviae]EKT9642275.1 LysR family transcriptional regulator [Pluralibacter gergoviae]EKV3544361.1 LysR family transcriptional regulator [Pluralibacter gergoviae]EKV6249015.1 LysR family transcriptional regulator [Pluralibacter gergoviae]EKV9899263.1 LysR family transcriptional regulator [Pluralibacter gergoviae]
MDKLRAMATFVAVAEGGSFTDAAARLEMSAVMVGKYVSQLEQRLGARLLERTTRRQSLTDAGRVYAEECRRVLEQVAAADASVERLRAAPAGTLRISAPVTFGACAVAPAVADFLTRYPEVRVELELSNRAVSLVEEGFDLAVRIGDLRDDSLVAKPLCLYRMVICASPDYLKRCGTPASPADLGAHRCLSHMVWNRRNAWHLAGEEARSAWQRDPVLRCDDGLGLKMAALAGGGLLLQPEILVRRELARGELVRVLDDWLPQPRPVTLLWRQDLRPLPKLSRFVETLMEAVGEEKKGAD